MPRIRASVAALLALAGATWAAASAGGASSSVVVSMEVPSATQLTNGCTAQSAVAFGVVQPGTSRTTATGAGACTVSFASSNDSAALRVGQRDARGIAMTSPDTAWSSGRTPGSFYRAIGRSGPSVAFAAGMYGNGARSLDGGDTWSAVSVFGSGDYVYEVDHVAASTDAWIAVGGQASIASTSNFASSSPAQPTWTSHRAALLASGWPASANVQGVAVATATRWYIVGDGGWMGRTNDGGTTFTSYQAPGVPQWQDVDVDPADQNSVVAVGAAATLATSSTGAAALGAWTMHVHPACNCWIHDVEVANATTAYAVSDAGWVMRWDGSSFVSSVVIDDRTFEPMGVATMPSNPNVVFVASSRGAILRSTDSGATFSRTDTPLAATLPAVAAQSPTDAIAVGGAEGVIRTTNGTSWTLEHEDPTRRALTSVAPHPSDGQRALAVGGGGTVLATTDGGTSWTPMPSGTSVNLLAVAWPTPTRVVAVGSGGTIRTSDDGGATWTARVSGTSAALRSIAAGDSSTIWAGGDGGALVRSTDGGSSWSAVASGTTAPIRSLAASGPLHAWIGGEDMTIRYTTNGGAAFAAGSGPPAWEQVVGLHARSTTEVVLATRYEGVWRSTDSGATYSQWGDQHVQVGSAVTLAGYGDVLRTVERWGTAGITTNGSSWSSSLAYASVDVMYVTAMALADPHTVYLVDDLGGIRLQDEDTSAAASIADYSTPGTDFGAAATTGAFGMCVQSLASASVAAPYVVDGGTCTASDADPWRAVPSTLQTVATSAQGVTGTATFVWGIAPRSDQPAGSYRAAIAFETIAPAV